MPTLGGVGWARVGTRHLLLVVHQQLILQALEE